MITIKEHRMRFSGHCWRSKEMISEVIIWETLHAQRKSGRPNKTYTAQLREDSGCTTDELKTVMVIRDEWRIRIMLCRASST